MTMFVFVNFLLSSFASEGVVLRVLFLLSVSPYSIGIVQVILNLWKQSGLKFSLLCNEVVKAIPGVPIVN